MFGRSGPHKGAALSHLTLTSVPAPRPWLGHASGPLCQAKLLRGNWGTKLNMKVLQPGSSHPLSQQMPLCPSPSCLPILLTLGGLI